MAFKFLQPENTDLTAAACPCFCEVLATVALKLHFNLDYGLPADMFSFLYLLSNIHGTT